MNKIWSSFISNIRTDIDEKSENSRKSISGVKRAELSPKSLKKLENQSLADFLETERATILKRQPSQRGASFMGGVSSGNHYLTADDLKKLEEINNFGAKTEKKQISEAELFRELAARLNSASSNEQDLVTASISKLMVNDSQLQLSRGNSSGVRSQKGTFLSRDNSDSNASLANNAQEQPPSLQSLSPTAREYNSDTSYSHLASSDFSNVMRSMDEYQPIACQIDNSADEKLDKKLRFILRSELKNLMYFISGSTGDTFLGDYRNLRVVVKKPKQMDSSQLDELHLNMNIPPHVNVLPLCGVCMEQDSYLLVTPFISKGSLNMLLKEHLDSRNPFNYFLFSTPSGFLNLADDILSGLIHIHSFNIIHRDIAPRNILINSQNVALLSDFGMSRKLNNYDSYQMLSDTAVPIRSMAPESLKFKQFSKASDIWSLGILFWQLLSQVLLPFPAYDNMQVIIGVSSGELTLPLDNISPNFARIISLCVAPVPEERATAVELLDIVRSIKLELNLK